MIRLLLCSLLLLPFQQAPSKELSLLRRSVCTELTKLHDAMAKKGYKSEVADCESIQTKVLVPDKMMPQKGAAMPFPGEKEYGEVCAAWSEAGKAIAQIYAEGEANLKGQELDDAKVMRGWFSAWAEYSRGILHLNKRRKACKLPPMTLDWSGTIGGYFHDLYLVKNKDDASTQGLGAHNEESRLPGYTPEGAQAAGGILGWGSAAGCVDMWMGSRFHRDPVFYRNCGRVAFGGRPGGCFSCRASGGAGGKSLGDIIHWPGADDTDISVVFAGEAPDPFPKGMRSSGTIIVVEYSGSNPGKTTNRLLGPDGKEVEILELDRTCFVAKEQLQHQTKYTVELVGAKGFKYSWSFTTK